MVKENVDILLISETKIDSSFSKVQFHIDGVTTYRRDRNIYGRGILLYAREDIPSTLLNIDRVLCRNKCKEEKMAHLLFI